MKLAEVIIQSVFKAMSEERTVGRKIIEIRMRSDVYDLVYNYLIAVRHGIAQVLQPDSIELWGIPVVKVADSTDEFKIVHPNPYELYYR